MSTKGKGGKKHRRGKNTTVSLKPNLPDSDQYYAYVTKILGSGRMELNYYKPASFDENLKVLEWTSVKSIGVVRGKMMKRVYVNLNDLVLVSERDFDKSKVDIIEKYNSSQIPYLKKESSFPNINEFNSKDVEFDFNEDTEDTENLDTKDYKNKKNESNYQDYLNDMPSFSDNENE